MTRFTPLQALTFFTMHLLAALEIPENANEPFMPAGDMHVANGWYFTALLVVDPETSPAITPN